MADNLRLRVILDLADKALGPIKRISAGSKGLADKLRGARDELRLLERQQKTIGAFRTLQAQFKASADASQALRERLAVLRGQMGPQTAAAAKALNAEIRATEATLRKTSGATAQQSARLGELRTRLQTLGVKNIAADEAALAARMRRTNATIDAQQTKLARLGKLRDSLHGTAMRGAAVTAAGWGARHAGTAMVQGAAAPLAQARTYAGEIMQITALGLGDEASKGAARYANAMKTYGTSTVDNLALMKDALTVFADEHHAEMVMPMLAKMKFANEAIFGAEHAGDADKKFMDMLKVIEMRGGTKSEEAFAKQANIVQQILTATGGRVGPEEWLNLIKTGGLAAKGMKDESFYYKLEALVQEMGGHRVGTGLMSAYQNIYQGKTTKRSALMLGQLGLVADPSKVKFDKVGQIAQLGVGALKGAELFQTDQFAWMEQILLPALAAKGITKEKDVLDAIGGIFSNRNAAGLFGTMYQQRDQIAKNARLNAGAWNIDQMYAGAKNTPAGNELNLLKKRDDLYLSISKTALPLYVAALEKVTAVLQRLNAFAQANPGLVKAMAAGFGVIAVGAVALGAVAIPVGILIAKFALMRYLLLRLLPGFSVFGLLRTVASGAGTVLARLGTILLWVGRAALAFLLTPLGAALALLAGAAYLVWRNWDGIKGGLAALWQNITTGASNLWAGIVALKDRFVTAGADLMRGLASGIVSGLTWVKDSIVGAATQTMEWFKGKLGINSPSRVFMALGQNIPEGAALGIQRGAPILQAAALSMAALPALAPMPALAGPGAGGGMAAPTAISITINAAPGQDPQAIARAVAAELDRRQREQRTRVLSQLSDIE